jgi:hypothetical protein
MSAATVRYNLIVQAQPDKFKGYKKYIKALDFLILTYFLLKIVKKNFILKNLLS